MKSPRDWYHEGERQERKGNLEAALDAFRQSAKSAPKAAAPWLGLARVLSRNQQPQDALQCLRHAAAAEPTNPSIATKIAATHQGLGNIPAAGHAFQQALKLDAKHVPAALGLAQLYEDMGEPERAARQYHYTLSLENNHAEALSGLLGLGEHLDITADMARAEQVLSNASDRDAALIGYGLGKALDKAGQFDKAFKILDIANQARARQTGRFDREKFMQRIENYKRIFSSDFFAQRHDWGAQADGPVFVVGLPRSGTTLTEQILGSHPQCFGAGELPNLSELATGTPDRLDKATVAWPNNADELAEAHIFGVGTDYLQQTRHLAPNDVTRIVDKQPLNFWHLGLVAIALPNAKIVHCRRDIRDVGLSIYSQNFNLSQRWATHLEDIVAYWRGYKEIMANWATNTSLRILNIDYEDTVADLPGQARRLLEFADLDWDERVLEFHNNARPVQTPSKWQVRKPLYASSKERWRNYADNIQPLAEAQAQG